MAVAFLVVGILVLAAGVVGALYGENRARRDVLANARLVSRISLFSSRRRAEVLDPRWQDRMVRIGRVTWSGMLILCGGLLAASGLARLIGY